MSRVTVNMSENLEKNIKILAKNKNKSISKIVSEAVEYYLYEIKKRKYGKKVLDLIGNVKMSPEILKELDSERIEDNGRA